MSRRPWLQLAAALFVAVVGASVARADASEWAALPVIHGNTDIRVEFGGFAVITRVAPPGAPIPYRWNLKVALQLSVQERPGGGVELPVHDDSVEFDWRSVDGRFKWLSDAWFWRSAVAGFYGLGNSTQPTALRT